MRQITDIFYEFRKYHTICSKSKIQYQMRSYFLSKSERTNIQLPSKDIFINYQDISSQLWQINSLSKKQKLKLLTKPLMEKLLIIIKLWDQAQLISQNETVQLDEQFQKLFLRMQYGCFQRGDYISFFDRGQTINYIILQGQITTSSNWIKNQPKKKTKRMGNLSIIGCNNHQKLKPDNKINEARNSIKFITNHRIPIYSNFNIQEQNKATDWQRSRKSYEEDYIANTHIKYFKFSEDNLQNFKKWLQQKENAIRINFLKKYLFVEEYYVKILKLYKCQSIHYNKKQIFSFDQSFEGCLFLIRKGSVQINLSRTQTNSNAKSFNIIANQGMILTKYLEQTSQQNISINYGVIVQDCLMHVISKNMLISLFQQIKGYKVQIENHLISMQRYWEECVEKNQKINQSFKQQQVNICFKGIKDYFHPQRSSSKRFNKRHSQQFQIQSIELDNQHNQFIKDYPYIKLVESMQNILAKKNSTQDHQVRKINSYLKHNEVRKKIYVEKILRMKIKNVAAKKLCMDKRKLDEKSNAANIIKRGFFDEEFDHLEIQTEKMKQVFLANNDMGIINEFLKDNHNYQKQLDYILRSSINAGKLTQKQNEQNGFYSKARSSAQTKCNEILKKLNISKKSMRNSISNCCNSNNSTCSNSIAKFRMSVDGHVAKIDDFEPSNFIDYKNKHIIKRVSSGKSCKIKINSWIKDKENVNPKNNIESLRFQVNKNTFS